MGTAGNSCASRVWKGSRMLRKAGLSILVFFTVTNIYSLDFKCNGELWKTRDSEELLELSYPVPFTEGSFRGISLDELFPAIFEAWTISITMDGGRHNLKLSDPELAERFSTSYLLFNNGSWDLFYQNSTYTDITELNMGCEVLDTESVEVWLNWEGTEMLRAELARYAELHNVVINTTEVPKPDSKLISVTQANGEIPDLVMVQSSYIEKLSKSGCIQNLGFMNPDLYIEQGIEAFSSDSKLWAVPFYYDAQLLFYNPEIVDTPDSSWNLQDFEAACRSAAQKGKIPAAWNAYSASFLIPFQLAFGKDRLIEADGSIIINDEPTLQALEYILELQQKSLFQPMERDAMTSLFVSGDAAMIISASYSIPHFMQLGIPFQAAPLPVNSITGRRLAPLLDFKAFAIAKRSRNTVAARRIIEYMTGLGVQQRFTSATAKLPALEKARLNAGETNPFYEPLKISSEDGIIIPTDKAYSIYKNTMWKMLRFAISGRMPADQVLEQTQALVDKNMEELK